MLPANSGTCWLGVLPSLHVSCVNARGLRVARLWRGHRQARARKTGEDDCRADAILEEISRILSDNSKAAIVKWKDDMKNRGLAARWVKSRPIVGVDLQHYVNRADKKHFEQCLASCRVQFIWRLQRSLRRDGIQELVSWDSLGVQLSRFADASFHSVNLVRCSAPVTVGDLPPGLACVDDFHNESFRILELAGGGLVTSIATPCSCARS